MSSYIISLKVSLKARSIWKTYPRRVLFLVDDDEVVEGVPVLVSGSSIPGEDLEHVLFLCFGLGDVNVHRHCKLLHLASHIFLDNKYQF